MTREWRKRLSLLPPDEPQLVQGLKKLIRNYLCLGVIGVILATTHLSNGLAVRDYIAFWSAARLALAGRPQDVYDPHLLAEASRGLLPGYTGRVHWYYPPPALLFYEPWGVLPYYVAWLLFISTTTGLLLWVMHRIVNRPLTLWATLAAPALAFNIWIGQNGALSAALFGLTLLWMERRPAHAGVSAAALFYKPHLAPLLVAAMIVSKRWRACIATVMALALEVAAATLIYGQDIWAAWWYQTPTTDAGLQAEKIPYDRMASVFGASRALGASVEISALLHVMTASAAVFVTLATWRRADVPFDIKAVIVVFATLLVSPYLYYYDYVLTLVGLAFWLRHVLATGWREYEYLLMVVVWGSPLWLVSGVSLPIAPLPPLILLGVLVYLRRRT